MNEDTVIARGDVVLVEAVVVLVLEDAGREVVIATTDCGMRRMSQRR